MLSSYIQYDFQEFAGNLAHVMFEKDCRSLNKKIQKNGDPHHDRAYECIHLQVGTFSKVVADVGRVYFRGAEDPKFLDVGCGVGQKVVLAQLLRFKGYGLEIRPKHALRASRLMRRYLPHIKKDDKRIFTADATKFTRYDEFDVIYFYRPSADEAIQRKIEMAIAEGAKKGAIVIPFGATLFDRYYQRDKAVRELGWVPVENSECRYNDTTIWKREEVK